jgi:hypothetical protein
VASRSRAARLTEQPAARPHDYDGLGAGVEVTSGRAVI